MVPRMHLLAASGHGSLHGRVHHAYSGRPIHRQETTSGADESGTADCNSVATCYTPQQLEVAYGVQPLLQRGIDGRGETVVLPELAESQLSPPRVTDLRQDFAAFDRLFHLPAPRLKVVSTFPHPAHPWFAFGEEVLDAEVVHTIAPRAALTIVLVKGTSLDSADQAVAASVAALRLGASEGGIISLSPAGQIGGEHCVTHAQLTQLNAALQADAAHHVTVVAATGDAGAAGEPCALITALGGSSPSFTPTKEPILVASDPLVLSAGGTTLDASHTTGAWIGETAWGLPYGDPGSGFQASGGGFSHLFARPSYQNGVAGIGAMRGVPDVAADANPTPGFRSSRAMPAVVIRSAGMAARAPARQPGPGSSPSPTSTPSATSASSTRPSTRSPAAPQYDQAFHDITAGPTRPSSPRDDHRLPSSPGWDPVTGWGSPDAEGARAPSCLRRKPLIKPAGGRR